jgi:hypothetical protein
MSSAPIDLLYLLAEVSIATVALSGITLVLAASKSGLSGDSAPQIAVQLRMASLITILAMLPLVLIECGLEAEILWRTSTAIYILAIIIVSVFNTKTEHSISLMGIVGVAGLSALLLLPANLWFAISWPYIAQLFVGWAVSLVLFLKIFHEILNKNVEKQRDI